MKKMLLLFVAFLFLGVGFTGVTCSEAINSYLPHWEHIPDGEPRVFEDPDNPGKYRVYIYGSHDTRKTAYCGYDLVTWSAPVEDLNDWRYEGVIFESIVDGQADVLFAPDVVEKKDDKGNKVYYLYPNNQSSGRNGMIAKSNSPKGPFEVCNWKEGSTTATTGVTGFDPAVFIDDDGRVYGYWGFQSSTMAEFDPETMCTVKAGCRTLSQKDTGIDGSKGDQFRFFEASSVRKVKDKYVFIYSRQTKKGEFGLDASNCTLAYAYSDTPLGPWTYGGTLVDARARETNKKGKIICAQQSWGNTHGSIIEINGQWYVFYHRCIDNSMYSRQAVVEAIDVDVTDEGAVVIREAEVTSQGFEINGLHPFKKQTAGSACYLTGGPRIQAHYDENYAGSDVVNITNGSMVGFKYLNFDAGRGTRQQDMLAVELIPKGKDGTVDIMLDRPWEDDGGTKIGSFAISASDPAEESVVKTAKIDGLASISGKHALYFVFKTKGGSSVCDLKAFQFGEQTVTDADEGQEPVPAAAPGTQVRPTPPSEQASPVPSSPTPNVPESPAPGPTAGEQASPAPSPVPGVQASPAPDEGKNPEPEMGKQYTVNGYTYRVAQVAGTKMGAVTVMKIKNKKVKKIKVPDTIVIKGGKYQVTAVGKKAFQGCRKAVKAVIGKNVLRIEAQAFQSCRKLKKISIRSKVLKKVGKNAWKGIHAKARITVPKKKIAKYKKMFRAVQGVKKSMKIVH